MLLRISKFTIWMKIRSRFSSRLFSFQILRWYLTRLDNIFKLIICQILWVYKGLGLQWTVMILGFIVDWRLLWWIKSCIAMSMAFFVEKFICLWTRNVKNLNDLLVDSECFHPWELLVFISHYLDSGFSFLAYFSFCTRIFAVQAAKLFLNLTQAFISNILPDIMLNLVLDPCLV